jgi:DNA-binding GntR family transcriptional regulator
VRLACQRPLPEQLKRLHALVDSERHCIARGGDSLVREFHLQLAEMAGNAPLAHFLGSLVPLTSLAIAR